MSSISGSEPDIAEVASASLNSDSKCVDWIKGEIKQMFPDEEAMRDGASDANEWINAKWSEEESNYISLATTFLMSIKATNLYVYLLFNKDKGTNDLKLSSDIPQTWSRLMYFVRDPNKFVTPDNVQDIIHSGFVQDDVTFSLLDMMSHTYVPSIMGNTSWPDSVKKDFSGQLNKFMANLTESYFQTKGKTVLYVPKEDIGEPSVTARDKELSQRLESALIHWTRQIKQVVKNTDHSELGEDAGPLVEIEFWRSRSLDLSGIREQLNDPGIKLIVATLECSRSSYLSPFQDLSKLIQREAVAAEDNLKFLSSLEEPCKILSEAEPKDISPILPGLLEAIKVIWNTSRFYNTDESLGGLLRKVSNEIINRCCDKISLTEIFDGNVVSCVSTLRESIRAGEFWKELYSNTADAIKDETRPWDFDTSSIFAHIDAFVQRCRDLLEVCESQMQFAPRTTLPTFGGTKGLEVTKSIIDIQAAFQKLVLGLKGLDYSILDVKATRWHDDYNTFKNGTKDLEVMLTNVIHVAFDVVTSLTQRIMLLETFQSMAKREAICRCVEKKTSEMYSLFLQELDLVKKHFNQNMRSPYITDNLPHFAGRASWAESLIKRIEKPFKVLKSVEARLPATPEAAELRSSHELTHESIQHYIQSQHHEWFNTIDATMSKRLENNLIYVDDNEGGLLTMNFDKKVLRMFQEVHYWERMQLEIPYVAVDIQSQRENFRVLQEHVLLVVRDYNKILNALNEQERKLFHDRIDYLDKCIYPGINKLTWISSQEQLEYFVKEALSQCKEVEVTVVEYKAANKNIDRACHDVSETLLISIEKRKVYDYVIFQENQSEHRDGIKKNFKNAYEKIKAEMRALYTTFANDSDGVQEQWIKYTNMIDKQMENSLRHTVKRSLVELSRHLNGDAKTEISPLFSAAVVLKRNRVELLPSIQDLFNMIHDISRELITVTSCMPRFTEQVEVDDKGDKQPSTLLSFYEIISNDEDTTLKTIVSITTGITAIVDAVQQFLSYWEKKYKYMWDQDKDAYIRRYELAKKPLSSFEEDINKYLSLQDEVLSEDASTTMRFLRIDCSPLKQSLVGQCEEWVSKFTQLLNNLSLQELRDIHQHFATNTLLLQRPLLNLDQLAEMVNLQSKLVDEREMMEARFQPLHDKYTTLEKFNVTVPEEETKMLENLQPVWSAFLSMLDTTAENLEVAKLNFHEKLSKLMESNTKEITSARDLFKVQAPFTNVGWTVERAFTVIDEWKTICIERRSKISELKSGIEIFNLQQPPYKELSQTEKDLEFLVSIWTVVKDWEVSFNSWKDGVFNALEVESMEESATRVNKRIVKLGREIRSWSVWGFIKEKIESFKRTMPLIIDLRNPAMRQRHWDQLMEVIGERFDPYGEQFTLASVMSFRLDQHAVFIAELSLNASKELGIEQALASIKETWSSLELDMSEYKDTFKMRSTEDLFAALEDNTVMLSTMKASKYFLVFEQEILGWEKSLSLVSETVELVLQVQRSWMYLENVFVGSEDIIKQLPQESKLFQDVHTRFCGCMNDLNTEKMALPATTKDGRLNLLMDFDAKLEKIQKSLENYLENKRQQFPRFYFLSSDDLLEILGQARDPMNVQSHLKKCFEGIKKLDMHLTDSRRHHESVGMYSPDGEYVSFVNPIITEGRPEEWLNHVEIAMFATTKKHLKSTLDHHKGTKKEKWVKENKGQCLISAGQIVWTGECERVLSESESPKSALRQLKKKWVSYLNKLTIITRSKLNKIDRKKVVGLITIEVHARDVIEKLYKSGCSSISDFEWVSQLRFYWDKELDECVVKQVLSVFNYGNEYQGNNGRLVITPLTDRCYVTLGAAMFTRRGGNPLGPAGTGKTETVKDFGKALARYVIVFNCSDGVDYKMTGKMLSGLAQTGAWACLDEFNRIMVEVLSVVATQISTVMQAIKERKKRFNFLGTEIRLIPTCAIAVTMNPGYAGRSELPDNLKAIMRPVSMMVPDFTLIGEIMMFAEGFSAAKPLAKKMIAIMELSQQQLSKQDHYDYGLRSFVIPIARTAGQYKRLDPEGSEEVLLYRTMLDLIKPKLVFQDLPLFLALLGDLFPGVEQPPEIVGDLRKAIEAELLEMNMQIVPEYVDKIIQIFDCKVARHGNMIVGKTGSGKSVAWKSLSRAMGKLSKRFPDNEEYQEVHIHCINPLALSNNELYGSFDEATHEWSDGVLARIMRQVCRDEAPSQKWILFDGPVDTLWIESMNTVLDDNKLLTLLSGERISMPQQVSILMEVEDLSVASPATVSRAGMIYLNVEDLGWRSVVTSWINLKSKEGQTTLVDTLWKLMNKYIDAALLFKRLHCNENVQTDPLNTIKTLMTLFDSLTADNASEGTQGNLTELWFLFCLIWSIGSPLDEDGRKKFDMFLRELDASYPNTGTVFDYYINTTKGTWCPWEDKLSVVFKPPVGTPSGEIMVPTVDTIRTKFVVSSLVNVYQHTVVVGSVGVGKTMVCNSLLGSNLPEGRAGMAMNFSAQTSSRSLQATIESRMEKRTKGVFAPAGGKKLVCFIDDLNMPQKSPFGFIPPLELLKLWIDNGFWYDRQKQEVKHIKDMQLIAAMAPAGGGRNLFSQRVLACYSLINMTMPEVVQLQRIYSSILNHHLIDFDDEIKPWGDSIATASIAVYQTIFQELLPTPSKSHYIFNTRDLAKVVLGVMQSSRGFYDNKEVMLQLWVHESLRIYGDRMWDSKDRVWLQARLEEKLNSIFQTSWSSLFETGEVMPFVSFMRDIEQPPYEPVNDISALKSFLLEKLEDYGLEPGCSAMDLVLFKDALNHVCRIHRILCQNRGNALLIGVGGSGRKSLSRLACYVAEMTSFSIEITKNYRILEFHEDIKLLYRQCGVDCKKTMFLIDDTQIVEETFLEDVNNILTSGEVPNLFPSDEIAGICDEVRSAAKAEGVAETTDALFNFFLSRVRNNLHLVLCMSPIGDNFRARCRMFPGLVNCTTIDWFTDWPSDALYEVAEKQLEEENLQEDVKKSICQVFVTAHTSVVEMSDRMKSELSRQNYVTPTNYLEFVNGYIKLLKEKRKTIGDKVGKLRGGLEKLDETATQVSEMQLVCQEKQVIVAKAKRECEELLVEIVQDKRIADEQEKQVNAEAEKITKETAVSDAIAKECQAGLDKALPALEAAQAALNVLTKKDMSELKAYSKPPTLVALTLTAVMTVLRKAPTWDESKKQMGETSFLSKLVNFDKDLLVDSLLKKVGKFTSNADFTPDKVGGVSAAAKGLCLWVRAMELYGWTAKEVAPKRAALKLAQSQLQKKQKALKITQDALAEVLAKVQALKDKYDSSTAEKERLQDELEDLEGKLGRAEKLVIGLAGEKGRWELSIQEFEKDLNATPGDVVIASAFLSYAGPFPSEYREELVQETWMTQVKRLNIPSSEDFDFASFLADPSDVRDWNIFGLPSDSFSTENGVLVTRSNRWPLAVDPAMQANNWIRNMEANNNLKILDLQMSDMVRHMENAIQFGQPVLLQNIAEIIDPVLEPLLSKSFIKRGNQIMIKMGDKEIDFNQEFKLFLTTKLANPHYTPEISTKTTIVNFAVKQQGLESQLLSIVVKKERPDLDKQKNDLVVKVAQGKRTQAELEDQILQLLSTVSGSLLDNVDLINTLDQSKCTWEEVNESLKIAEETSKKLDIAANAYQPCAVRAAVLYFVLNDLSRIDPMYQFSLAAYVGVFTLSISKSNRPDTIEERIKSLNDYHTFSVYNYTARGLFERHKLLLSLQMCAQILFAAGQINKEEWQFFLLGGQVLDKEDQVSNPALSWISEAAWDNITELDKLPHFKGIVSSFEQSTSQWEEWYRENSPEAAQLPGEWENKCNELQHMVLVRSLRPDRVIFSATSFVANALGRKFVEPPVLNLMDTYNDSCPQDPLIFVLSPGVDPLVNLQALAKELNMANKFFSVALGQGQAPIATQMINDAAREGNLVFLANCHLMTTWLPTLEKLLESLKNPHEDFRLWMSSNPSPDFPMGILQKGIKMTTEPPKGFKANLQRLYATVTEEAFAECRNSHKYQKLFFALCYFHSVLLERRKFRTLGLNIPYDFNDTDLKVSDDLLKTYLDKYEETPWDALKYLIAEANYGGRVTDELDRRVLNSYLNQFYCEETLAVQNYPLSPLSYYYIPDTGSLQSFKDYISTLPTTDRPEAFGQHPNADISYQIEDSKIILDSLVSLQPKAASAGASTSEAKVSIIIQDLKDKCPKQFNLEDVIKSKADDPSALHTVLFQEIDRYNTLLESIITNCESLEKGIKGLVVMSGELETMFDSLDKGRVPAVWLKAYPSLLPLGSWMRDLIQRIAQLTEWVTDTYPNVFWLSGFTYPTGFLTSVLQTTARKNALPIDTLSWEFTIINLDEKEITQPPKEGVYIKGMFLEGAGWDFENGCLAEPDPMVLIVPMPIVHFKPIESKKRSHKGIYSCPLYIYPVRTGSRERPSYTLSIDLKSGTVDPEHWVKRGTALLLSLST